MVSGDNRIAAWAVTPHGLHLTRKLQQRLGMLDIYCSRRLAEDGAPMLAQPFDKLLPTVAARLRQYDAHVFIMATGIVVRAIGPLLQDKSVDPAVVVVDDRGKFAISLVSGHIGGANRLADRVARVLGAQAVITTATDVNQRPAIDLMAQARELKIENPAAIKGVNMALLLDERFPVYDPQGWLPEILTLGGYRVEAQALALAASDQGQPALYVGDQCLPLPPAVLILRPPSLTAGIGCNRGTPMEEMRGLLEKVLSVHHLSSLSIGQVASIDVKQDEAGLSALARELGTPQVFFTQAELNQIRHVPNPSPMALKHVGVHSVCEAAAILAARQGRLIVPKQKTANVTIAIARHGSISSASAPET